MQEPHLYEKKWPFSKSGLGVIGTIVLMPISCKYTLILYDKETYRLSNRKKIIEISARDLNILNYCQFLQSDDCVYFNTVSYTQEEFHRYAEQSKAYRENSKTITDTSKYYGKKNSEIIHSSHIDLPIEQRFDFIGILEKAFNRVLPSSLDISRDNVKKIELNRKERNSH